MSKAIYPGSFDPVTNGHIDIIARSANLFDEIIVAVLYNSKKVSTFSVEERVAMLEKVTKDYPNVRVASFSGLTIDFARKVGADVMVRGLRAITDFDYELQIAQTNKVQSDIETIFLTTDLNYSYLSSTVVKEFASYGSDISHFVPEEIIGQIYDKFK